jgi:hypothetical protein
MALIISVKRATMNLFVNHVISILKKFIQSRQNQPGVIHPAIHNALWAAESFKDPQDPTKDHLLTDEQELILLHSFIKHSIANDPLVSHVLFTLFDGLNLDENNALIRACLFLAEQQLFNLEYYQLLKQSAQPYQVARGITYLKEYRINTLVNRQAVSEHEDPTLLANALARLASVSLLTPDNRAHTAGAINCVTEAEARITEQRAEDEASIHTIPLSRAIQAAHGLVNLKSSESQKRERDGIDSDLSESKETDSEESTLNACTDEVSDDERMTHHQYRLLPPPHPIPTVATRSLKKSCPDREPPVFNK